MGVTLTRDPGSGKTDGGVGKTETNKIKPKKGKVIHLVSPGKEAAPQEYVGSRTRDRAKAGPREGGTRAHEKDCRYYDLQPVKGKEWILCSRGTRGNEESLKKQISSSPLFFKII
jgi:hypothetical protein